MKISLNDEQEKLLLKLFYSHGIKQFSENDKLTRKNLSKIEIDQLCELISDEFMLNGIEEDFEPNEYGRQLESLLDAVNRERLRVT